MINPIKHLLKGLLGAVLIVAPIIIALVLVSRNVPFLRFLVDFLRIAVPIVFAIISILVGTYLIEEWNNER